MAPQFCQHCAELPEELTGTEAGGQQNIGGVESYVVEGKGGKGTIIFATDIYGLGIKNSKLVADELAKQSGSTIVVPDYFEGDPMRPEEFVFPKHSGDGLPPDEQMQKNMGNMGAWVGKGHSPNETYPMVKKVIDAVKGPVGIVGFCYGGKIAGLAAQDGIVKSAVIYHAAMLEPEEASKVKVPVLLNMAELDPTFNSIEEAWEKTLKEKNLLDPRSQKFAGTVHGFGTRPAQDKPEVVAAHKKALSNTAAFFQETLVH